MAEIQDLEMVKNLVKEYLMPGIGNLIHGETMKIRDFQVQLDYQKKRIAQLEEKLRKYEGKTGKAILKMLLD